MKQTNALIQTGLLIKRMLVTHSGTDQGPVCQSGKGITFVLGIKLFRPGVTTVQHQTAVDKGVIVGAFTVAGFVAAVAPGEKALVIILPVAVQAQIPLPFFVVAGFRIKADLRFAGPAQLIVAGALFFNVGNRLGGETEQAESSEQRKAHVGLLK